MEPLHTDRARAEAFGSVARDYDRFRPRYPANLLSAVLSRASDSGGRRVLDVGAGTGILAMQLQERGCDVLALEPDPAMAAVAADKGLSVETATFEAWDPAGRAFDVVTFGQSFHWVDPESALPRIRGILRPAGTLALAWNDIVPVGPLAHRIREILDEHLPAPARSRADDDPHPTVGMLRENGFDADEMHVEETLAYRPEDWLSMIATHSAQLTMGSEDRRALHSALRGALGRERLKTQNRALLICARPRE